MLDGFLLRRLRARRMTVGERLWTTFRFLLVVFCAVFLHSLPAAASVQSEDKSAVFFPNFLLVETPSPPGVELGVLFEDMATESIRGYEAPQLLRETRTSVATKPGTRFVVNSAGETLDLAKVTIPEAKFGYLLENPSKSGVFGPKGMGFNQAELDVALRQHLVTNFGSATPSTAMTGGGTKFSVTGAMTGPSGQKWTITTAWGVDANGTIRLITATP